MQDNIVGIAKQNGLTLKQELFCRGTANGLTGSEAARKAGYNEANKEHPTLPSRMLKNERIQSRISSLIAESSYDLLGAQHWKDVLTAEPPEDWDEKQKWNLRLKLWEAKDRALGIIARLGGWEPNKVSETKSLVLKGNLDELLPK